MKVDACHGDVQTVENRDLVYVEAELEVRARRSPIARCDHKAKRS